MVFSLRRLLLPKSTSIHKAYFGKYRVLDTRGARSADYKSQTIFFFKKTVNSFKLLKTALSRIFYGSVVKTKPTTKVYYSSFSRLPLFYTKNSKVKPQGNRVFSAFYKELLKLSPRSTYFKTNSGDFKTRSRSLHVSPAGVRVLTFMTARYGKRAVYF